MPKPKRKRPTLRQAAEKLKRQGKPAYNRRYILSKRWMGEYIRKHKITGPGMKLLMDLTSKTPHVREVAVGELVEAGPWAAEPLIRVVKKDFAGAPRKLAIQVLGERRDASAVKPLIALALKNENPALRKEIVGILPRFKDVKGVDNKVLVKALLSALKDPENYVREAAVRALSKFPFDLKVTDALTRLFKDKDTKIRFNAVESIRKLQAYHCNAKLFEPALNDPDYLVRQEAVRALRELGLKQSGPTLIKALRDSSLVVARSAALAFNSYSLFMEVKPEIDDLILTAWSKMGNMPKDKVGLLTYAIASNASLQKNLPASEKDERRKIDYLTSLIRQAKEHSFEENREILLKIKRQKKPR